MCELLGMSARLPASITLSLNELARHGGETGPHVDGWGIAFYEGPDANLIRESTAAANSTLMSTLRSYKVESEIVLAHIRLASRGSVKLRNTHPFRRELAGRVHTFAHNGHLSGIKDRFRFSPFQRVSPIGDTDSEHAFCALMQRLSLIWIRHDELPALSKRIEIVADFAREIGEIGPANFLYSDGDALFVHGHIRTQADGQRRAPGLHYLSVECNYGVGQSKLVGVEFESKQIQQVTLVSTSPLREGGWIPMSEGQLLVVQGGKIVHNETYIRRATTALSVQSERMSPGCVSLEHWPHVVATESRPCPM